ncbi:MAG TPA: YciI family protein [Steroidobacteraceae bacterium]|nr:YciI family protein [Steroidobacteraceae bacterium]
MSYMLLIVEPQGQRRERSAQELRHAYQRMLEFAEQLQRARQLVATNSLREDAVRVRLSGGKPVVLDGPFTEAREMIGGFFLLSCQTRAEALAIAGRCPAAEWATVEVRELGPC